MHQVKKYVILALKSKHFPITFFKTILFKEFKKSKSKINHQTLFRFKIHQDTRFYIAFKIIILISIDNILTSFCQAQHWNLHNYTCKVL